MRLNNSDLNRIVRRTNDMSSRMRGTCSGVIRSTSALTGSSAFRGQAAGQLFSYLNRVTRRAASDLSDLSQDVANLSTQMENAFAHIEPRREGNVDRQTLIAVQRNLSQRRDNFNRTLDQVNALNRQASKLVFAPAISGSAVNASFTRSIRFASDTETRIAQIDRTFQGRAQALLRRIERVNAVLRSIRRVSLSGGSFSPARAIRLAERFSRGGGQSLLLRLLEDPFARRWFVASQNPWASMIGSLGPSRSPRFEALFSRGNAPRVQDGVFSMGGEAGILRDGVEFDAGPLSPRGLVDVLTASGFMRMGNSPDFAGLEGKGEIVKLRAGGSTTLGTRNFQMGHSVEGVVGELSGSFQAFDSCADNSAMGLRWNAVAAEVSSTKRMSAIAFDSQGKDKAGNPVTVERHLLSASLTGSVGVGTGGGGGTRVETVRTFGPISLNAVTIDAKGKIPPIGVKGEITVPEVTVFGFNSRGMLFPVMPTGATRP